MVGDRTDDRASHRIRQFWEITRRRAPHGQSLHHGQNGEQRAFVGYCVRVRHVFSSRVKCFCIRRLLLSDTIGLYLKEAVVCGWVCGWLVCNGVSLSGPWNSMSSMSFSCTCGWVRDLKFCIRIPSLNTFLRAWFHHDPNIINTLKIP